MKDTYDLAIIGGGHDSGLGAITFLAWFFFGPKRAQAAQVKGNVQEIVVTVKGGYSPDIIRVKKGIPLRLIFNRQEAGECSSRVVFPDFQDTMPPHSELWASACLIMWLLRLNMLWLNIN